MNETPTVLFVPGLRDHVEGHWQTIAARKIPGSHTVAPLERDKLSCEARVAALEAAYRKLQGPVVLAAHSAGVTIAVHWARRHGPRLHGALLAAPADLEMPLPEGYPRLHALASSWLELEAARGDALHNREAALLALADGDAARALAAAEKNFVSQKELSDVRVLARAATAAGDAAARARLADWLRNTGFADAVTENILGMRRGG